jgi:hypothetical protein
MDFKGQTAVLSAILVLVGIIFLVPAITEKALAEYEPTIKIHATAKGVCTAATPNPNMPRVTNAVVTQPCHFTWETDNLEKGKWTSPPSRSGTDVTWSAEAVCTARLCLGGVLGESGIIGSVTYKVGEETAVLSFENPVIGYNKCSISGIGGSCTGPGKGYNAEFEYNLRGK